MKTEQELSIEILNITMKINEKFPELSKYITEMPVTIPNAEKPEINNKTLLEYKESLELLLIKYTKDHENKISNL